MSQPTLASIAADQKRILRILTGKSQQFKEWLSESQIHALYGRKGFSETTLRRLRKEGLVEFTCNAKGRNVKYSKESIDKIYYNQL